MEDARDGSHSLLRALQMSAATNDDCLSSACIFVRDKRYEELGRTARYGEEGARFDAGWRNGLDVTLVFGCTSQRKPQRLLFELINAHVQFYRYSFTL
ncbi:hypothetical protein ARMSODRAFT_1018913 [Armillaria solidipes]|uniref:Uncharacterized protein n=1 Tax=Armillaria solidipes TaxID=1076256 RepID=A0A2H3BRC2_9AGAR|nr:hypothetical protein ARMSODRAFT_1018913 [Armillaria solidipes]